MRSVLVGLLVCVPAFDDPKEATPREHYQALLREYEAADKAWNERYASKSGDEAKVDWKARYRDWPGWSFAPRFVTLAGEAPDDPAATDALLWVVNRSLNVGVRDRQLAPHHKRALGQLERTGRFDDEGVKGAYRQALRYPSPDTEHFLRVALEKARDREARGLACLGLARLLAAKAEVIRRQPLESADESPVAAVMRERTDPAWLAYLREGDPGAADDEAGRLFERAAAEFGDVVFRRAFRPGGHDLTVGEAARSELNELRHLAVGKVAPEVAGDDADGKALKLSDYRGKVVVLTFSGNWCGPCVGMYPQERELVKRLAGKPFALLSVNTDQDRATLRKAIDSGEITWRCWWDRGIEGPICSAWNVTSFPTVYVLDGKGVIRFKDLRGESLDQAVDTLMKDSGGPQP